MWATSTYWSFILQGSIMKNWVKCSQKRKFYLVKHVEEGIHERGREKWDKGKFSRVIIDKFRGRNLFMGEIYNAPKKRRLRIDYKQIGKIRDEKCKKL